MSQAIAIVGMACRYPDAADPGELWTNVLAGRRAFRRIPDERMRLDDYWSADPAAPDRFYTRNAAVIEGFDFDRVGYKIAGSTYRVTDLTHWLALDTAARALADAGFPGADGLPRLTTAVIVGNSLTGEFTRANLMRLRWPYVRRVVGAALTEQGWGEAELAEFLAALEERYKSPFPPVDEDALAGGLSNTIAGRICNQFDLKGGGFTVDGACSSSLLAVAQGCNALRTGEIDAAVVGGVDLSIDPFEVIGFAKTGALATGEMRVYDSHSNGFWPGEGCGMLVLLREADARAKGLRCYATIAGWGYASDGRGGMTRPEADGHKLAVQRAYRLAGFDIGSVSYLEGHGTGTAVGDATELRALSQARREARQDAAPAAISTLKGNIGHTKAAAGIGGLIKATLAVHHQVIPPATSHYDPHPELAGASPALRVPSAAELWPQGQEVRAAVSSMGFGGINTHVVVETAVHGRRASIDPQTAALVRSRQDCEVLLLDAGSTAELRDRAGQLAGFAGRLSYGELTDLAVGLQRELAGWPVRAAIVAASPEQAASRLAALCELLAQGKKSAVDAAAGVFLGTGTAEPPIGFLFPGQGAGKRNDGGALARRFEEAGDLYSALALPTEGDLVATAVAQPRIVASSAAALRVLRLLGIEAVGAVGHSLGELTSLYWAGAMDEAALFDLAAARGRVMAHASDGGGTMASVMAGPKETEPLLRGEPVVIAGYNGPRQTVISGPAAAVGRVCEAAAKAGLATMAIAVSHAFHSPAVAPAAQGLADYLAGQSYRPLTGQVLSTVTGCALAADTDVRDLLVRQVLEPVHFDAATRALAAQADLLIEVGPGRILSGLAGQIAPQVPAIALDADGTSLNGLLSAVAAAFVLGAPVRHDRLFAERFAKPLPLDKEFKFFVSPCELAPADVVAAIAAVGRQPDGPAAAAERSAGGDSSLDVLRRLMAQRAELPLDAVRADSRPLDDLHFSSITVGQIVNQATRELGVSAPVATATFATATVADLAQMLDDLTGTALPGDAEPAQPDGVAPWVRAFTTELVEQARPAPAGSIPAAAAQDGTWQVFASHGHPLATRLGDALRAAGLGNGVLLCLPERSEHEHIPLMLDAARAALAAAPCRFVAVGGKRGAAGLAKTLHLEAPDVAVATITLPLPAKPTAKGIKTAVAAIVADAAATSGFSEVHYDAAGTRLVPVLRPLSEPEGELAPLLGPRDVLLVTGGGKGITAECALAMASQSGAAVGLLGRSDPAADPDLTANLARMAAAGVRYHYERADVTSAEQVKGAVSAIVSALGPVTALLHGAGRNVPVPVAQLDEIAFASTLAPKIAGLEAVLAAVDPARLKLLVTFGSIIGRAGLRGQADYATANDWMTELTGQLAAQYPRCRCLALEWSVWAGAGMGERLGVLESLTREGISPITVDEGIATLLELTARRDLPVAMVVMGRAGGLPTITLEPRELPLARFLERPRVHYPGVELVADLELSADSDLYLADHNLDDELLFPAVFGIEAMTQAAAALAWPAGQPPGSLPVLDDVAFERPIVIPPDGTTGVRVAALRTGDRVDVVIRSSDTSYQADHFRATVRWQQPARQTAGPVADWPAGDLPAVRLDPGRDLYGDLLFQGKRFQRVLGYRAMAAMSCVAEISTETADSWFSAFFPAGLLLGDPGARDAFMHAIQCCVPNATLLPQGVDRISPGVPREGATRVVLAARERSHEGDSYTYDLDVRDTNGELVERWEGLRLRAVRKQDGAGPWPPALLGPYFERQLAELGPWVPRCVVEPDGSQRARGSQAQRKQTALALSRLLGRPAAVRYRRDGKPEVAADVNVSISHNAGLTLAVGFAGQVGCDAEVVADRTAAEWQSLLGDDHYALAELLARERDEDLAVSATRVWGAIECLRKAGRAVAGPITAGPGGPGKSGRWAVLRAGRAQIATFPTMIRDEAAQVVFAVLTEGES